VAKRLDGLRFDLVSVQGTEARKNRAGAEEVSPTITCPVYITLVAMGVQVLKLDEADRTTLWPGAAAMVIDEA
jgi:hypothetical protein